MRSKSSDDASAPAARAEPRLVFLLSVAQRRLQRWVAARGGDSGVTAAQAGLLFVVGERDGILMSEAAVTLDLNPPGISGLVERMMAANLIRRRADPEDGRAWRLSLTPAGRAALVESRAELVKINARLRDGFSEAEIDVVARWLMSIQRKFPKGEDQ